MAESAKEKISSTIAEEVINEMMMAGIALVLVLAGVNYFGMEWGWLQGMGGATESPGLSHSVAAQEASRMITDLTHTFPFKYFFNQDSFYMAVVVAICLTALGLLLKAFTVKTKGKFIIELGKELYIPAIVAFFGIIILQVWTAFNVSGYIMKHNLSGPEFGSGYFIWNTYGQLFLFGAAMLVIGSIVKLVGESNKARKTIMIGNTMFNGGFTLVIYYIIIRIISMDVIMQSSAGKVLKIFIVSNHFSGYTIAACVFIFAFGRALRDYGVSVLKHEKRMHAMAAMQHKYEFMKREYGAKPAAQQPQRLRVGEHHLRQQPHHHGGAGEKYVMSEGQYRHQK
jgi:hypothetical protein